MNRRPSNRLLVCLVSLVLVLSLLPAAKSAQEGRAIASPPSGNALTGVWGSENVFGPLVRGSLTIDGRGSQWRASIAGFDLPVSRKDGRVAFTLPGTTGEFRGRVEMDSKTIDGQWIQPAGVVLGSRYATPVHLAAIAPSVWKGTVVPLDDRISFYVSIQTRADQSMTAFIVNPELNLFRRRTYVVTVDGSRVVLTNPKRAGDVVEGTYDRAADQLRLPLLDSSPPLQFSRRTAGDAVGFYARTPATRAATYDSRPIASGDGWPTASLRDVGMDEKPILALVEKILSADPADNPLDIDSLLIARHGKLVFEQYFHGYDADRPHDMRSASKTFAGMLVGIARERGVPIGPATPVYRLFGKSSTDERKSRITVQTLLTMRSGLACDDNDEKSPGNEDTMQSQTAQPDWYQYTLDLPMAAEPGGRHAVYCSAAVNLAGGAVSRAARLPLPEMFEAYVARPLHFSTYHMNLMPTGEAYTGGGLHLRPRDELKLGQLYLSGGTWNGKRVVSREWVRESITAHAVFDPQTDYEGKHEYGYGWHINHLTVGKRSFDTFSAGGNGGQIVMVVPQLDLVVAFNGGSYGEFNKWYRWGLQLVPQYIIPAVRGGR